MSNRQLPDGLRRLNKLADLLETAPPEAPDQFDLASWRCGFAMCAVGFAATTDCFMAEGLHLAKLTLKHYESPHIVPRYGDAFEWDAVRKFFDLTEDEAASLFDPSAYDMANWRNPRAVIIRIRALVTHKTALLSMLTHAP